MNLNFIASCANLRLTLLPKHRLLNADKSQFLNNCYWEKHGRVLFNKINNIKPEKLKHFCNRKVLRKLEPKLFKW